jgi:hypothetical protein
MRDFSSLPPWLREALQAQQRAMSKLLMRDRPDRPIRLQRAALGHALNFHTYRSLVHEQGLKVHDAVDLMVEFVSRA